jgi:hypothetical protein
MNSNYIKLWDVVQQIDHTGADEKPVRFQLKYVTADRKKCTGGDIVELVDARNCAGKTKTGEPKFIKKKSQFIEEKIKKNPSHWLHSTRNMLLPNGQVRTVHVRLIIEFNHMQVCY